MIFKHTVVVDIDAVAEDEEEDDDQKEKEENKSNDENCRTNRNMFEHSLLFS